MNEHNEPVFRKIFQAHSFNVLAWYSIRVIVAGILLYAAYEKSKLLISVGSITSSDSLLESPLVNYLAVIFESAFAIWVLSGLVPKSTLTATIAIFTAFAGISLAKWIAGKESCGCFGERRINPSFTFILDSSVVFFAYLCSKYNVTIQNSKSVFNPKKKLAIVLISCFVISSVMISSKNLLPRDASVLISEEQNYSPNSIITVTPNLWLHKKCPLLKYCRDKNKLSTGQWFVMINRSNCGTCLEAFPKVLSIARSQKISLAVIAANEEKVERLDNEVELSDRLAPQYRWNVRTPSVFKLDDGVVTEILY